MLRAWNLLLRWTWLAALVGGMLHALGDVLNLTHLGAPFAESIGSSLFFVQLTGGYGTVGRRVAADLAPDCPGRVVVAGRSAEKAAQLAAELGHGVRGRRVDVGEPDSVEAALEGVGVVMSCIDQPEPHLLRAAIGRGLAYTDIAPHLMTRRPTEAMMAEAAGAIPAATSTRLS